MADRVSFHILTALLFAAHAVGAEPSAQPHGLIVQQLENDDEQVRAAAETRLIRLGAEAVDALVDATCRNPSPTGRIADATLRILKHWEQNSWTNPDSKAAIDKFVQLARDPKNSSDKHRPLSPTARYPFAEQVRFLDISPDEAAAYLRTKRGVKISESPGRREFNERYYTSVSLTRDWIPDPKDWLYIANLTREIKGTHYIEGTRHPIAIDIVGPVKSDLLVECFKFFRKSANCPFELFLADAHINRKSLLVLASYPGLTGLLANSSIDEITDEDWAACISAWPNVTNLLLLSTAGRKAIAAASKLDHLTVLKLKNPDLTEVDLEPFRNNKKLQVLWLAGENAYIEYLNQAGTGKWQVVGRKN